MRHVMIGLSVVAMIAASFVPRGTVRAQTDDVADLAVTVSGSAPTRVKVGGSVAVSVSVTNLGPGAASGAQLTHNEADQFNLESVTCSDPALCALIGEPPGATLASGASATATFAWSVPSLAHGESRTADVSIGVRALTPDPNPANDSITLIIRLVGSGQSAVPAPKLVDLIAAGDRDGIRAWAADRSIAEINRAVAALSSDRRNRLAEVVLDSNATGATRDRLLSVMRLTLAQRDLGFYAEIWSYTRIEMTPGGFFGTCRMLFIDEDAYAGLVDVDARNVLTHETLHSFNCVNGGPAGSLDEGSALWVIKAGFREPLGIGESWAEGTYGSKLFFRDIVGDPNLPLEAPRAPTQKLLDVYGWLASVDPSRLPWNSTPRLVTCFERYWEGLNRNVDFVTEWLPAAQAATDRMLADPECRPL